MIKVLRKQNGVTLIELLVVVVILGIIAAIAIPAVMSNQKEAYGNTNLQNLQIVQEAVERYAIHNKGKYPVDSNNTVDFEKLISDYIKSEPKIYMKDDTEVLGWPIDSKTGKVSLPANAQDGN